MAYRFRATETFWRRFYALPGAQKESVRAAWKIFRDNPFDARLATHKINALSGRAGKTIWSVYIEGDLRAVFVIDADLVTTLDIGDHGVYR